MTQIVRNGYEMPGRPTRVEWDRLTMQERLALPSSEEGIPTWAVEPEFRRRQFSELAGRIQDERGPAAVIKAQAELERQIRDDEVLWQEYLVSKHQRATA